jgi:hypothetical protein
MGHSIVTSITTLIHAPPILVAGLIALLGLLLWSAGVKVARPVAAALGGAAMAGVAWGVLPPFLGIPSEMAALIGLAAGVVIGAMGLRVLQGAVLAICLAIAASGGYYVWQAKRWAPVQPARTTAAPAPHAVQGASSAAQPLTKTFFNSSLPPLPAELQQTADQFASRWQGIPTGLRQSMVVIAGGVMVLVMMLSWQAPRYTTWLVSAAAGTVLLLLGGMILLEIFSPRHSGMIPKAHVLAAIAGAVTLTGMLVQRVFFWPGKREAEERRKDRSGETVPAV